MDFIDSTSESEIDAPPVINMRELPDLEQTLGDLILTPARFSTVFLAGLYKIGESHLYVNRGLGTTGPPIRIGAPPEITHLTLKSV